MLLVNIFSSLQFILIVQFVVGAPKFVLKYLKTLGISFLDQESVEYFDNVADQVLDSVVKNPEVNISAKTLVRQTKDITLSL